MNREVIIAIILGFGIGLIVTYGIWTANRSLKEQQSVSPIPTPIDTTQTQPTDESSQPTSTPDTTLRLTEPKPNTLTDQDTITVSGFAQATDTIIILSENDELTLDPQENGEFNAEINLDTGINYLTVFSVDTQGDHQRIDQTIILSSE